MIAPPPRRAAIALTARDLADAIGLNLAASLRRPHRYAWIELLMWVVAVGSTAVAIRTRGGLDQRAAVLAVIAGLGLALRTGWAARFISWPNALRQLRSRPHLRQDMQLDWDEDGLTLTAPTVAQRMPWTDMTRWGETRRVLAFTAPAIGALCMPKRCLSAAQLDDLRELARQAAVPGMREADTRPPSAVLAAFEPVTRRDAVGGVVFRLSFDDVRRVNRQRILLRVPRWQTVALAAACAACVALFNGSFRRPDAGALIEAAAVGSALAIFATLVVPWLLLDRSVQAAFRQRRDLAGDIRLWWDAASVHSLSETTEWHAAWSEVRRWREDDAVVWLDLARGGGQIMPKRAFTAGQTAELRHCAAAAGVRGPNRA